MNQAKYWIAAGILIIVMMIGVSQWERRKLREERAAWSMMDKQLKADLKALKQGEAARQAWIDQQADQALHTDEFNGDEIKENK